MNTDTERRIQKLFAGASFTLRRTDPDGMYVRRDDNEA